jgi:hypothetical protein
MSFSFGFSGDDIEEDPNDVNTQNQQEHVQEDTTPSPAPIPARTHDLDELVGTRVKFLTVILLDPILSMTWQNYHARLRTPLLRHTAACVFARQNFLLPA